MAAVEGLTRGQALKLGAKGITVNAAAPGTTETKMLKAGKPEDIADAVAFVCFDDARWTAGKFIDVSGGLRVG